MDIVKVKTPKEWWYSKYVKGADDGDGRLDYIWEDMQDYCDYVNQFREKVSENLIEVAKKEVGYKRQVAIFGQKAADNVLSFWILGFQYCKDLK